MISVLSTGKCSNISAFKKKKIHSSENKAILWVSVSLRERRRLSSTRKRSHSSSYLIPWGLGPHLPLLMVINVEEYVRLNSAMGLNRITDWAVSFCLALSFPAIKYLVFFSELPSELQIHGEHLWSQAIFYSCSKDCAKDGGERHEQALSHVLWWLNSLQLSIFWYFWLFTRSNQTCFSAVCYSQKTFFTHINYYNIFEP